MGTAKAEMFGDFPNHLMTYHGFLLGTFGGVATAVEESRDQPVTYVSKMGKRKHGTFLQCTILRFSHFVPNASHNLRVSTPSGDITRTQVNSTT